MRRFPPRLALALLLAIFLPRCDAPAPEPLLVRADATLLGKLIHVPEGVKSVHFTEVSRGAESPHAPGPADRVLYVYLALGPSRLQDLAATLGPAPVGAERVPARIVTVLAPGPAINKLRREGDDVVLDGPHVVADFFSRDPYRAVFAVPLGSGLFLRLDAR